MERKHAALKDQTSYGEVVALQQLLGTAADSNAAKAEIVDELEEESEDEDELICDFCYGGKDAGKGTMHLCEGG